MQFFLVDTGDVPGGDLNPDAVEGASGALRLKGTTIRERGVDCASDWRKIGDHYDAPEAPRLLRAMDVVRDSTAQIATDTHAVCDHLDAHATELRALQAKRSSLVAEISNFRAQVGRELDGLGGAIADIGLTVTLPPELMGQNDSLHRRIDMLREEITTAQEECADRIRKVDAPTPQGFGHQLADGLGAGAGWAIEKFGWGDSEDVERFTDTFLNNLMNPDGFFGGSFSGMGGLALAGVAGMPGRGQAGQSLFNDWMNRIEAGINQGQNFVDDAMADMGDWFSDRGEAIIDDWGNVGDASVAWWNAAVQPYLDGEDAKTTEVGASTIRWFGSLAGALGTTSSGGLLEQNVFDDGAPTSTMLNDDLSQELSGRTPALAVPTSMVDLAQGMRDAYDSGEAVGGDVVRVTMVEGPQGPRAIVTIPGTDASIIGWTPKATSDLPNDLTGNLVTAGGSESTMTKAVRMAMEQADIPEDAEVMMIGHSQGGMTAAQLASNQEFVDQYNVTNLVTMGSPIDNEKIVSDVTPLELEMESDLVPTLDLGNQRLITDSDPARNENHTKIVLPDQSNPFGVISNHVQDGYYGAISDSDIPELSAEEQRLRDEGFLLSGTSEGTDERVSGQDVRIGRTDRMS